MKCEVCGHGELREVLNLGDHPMCDDLISIGDGRVVREYPIEILYCSVCRTAHQKYQIPKRTLFPESYHYRARHTADVLNGMRHLVERCERQCGSLQGLAVLDIGCNDGSLLSIFAEKVAVTIGIEPTGAASDARMAGHKVFNDYLTPDLAAQIVGQFGKPDIITFTNVFAHIENLPEVLSAVRTLMGPKTLLVVENHYLGAVLERYQFDTFYHEHPRTYSLTSFKYIADSLDANIVTAEFPERYGGNIRIMMQKNGRGDAADLVTLMDAEADFGDRLRAMGQRIPHWRQAKSQAIAELVSQYGPLSGKAFPGRAAILVKLLGLDHSMISAVYEKPGSMKIGHYVPGTSIPILSDDDFVNRASKTAPLINLAWHISKEIHGYMRKQGYQGAIVDIFSKEEFEHSSPLSDPPGMKKC